VASELVEGGGALFDDPRYLAVAGAVGFEADDRSL